MIITISREFKINENQLRNGTGDMYNETEDETVDILSSIMENPESEFYQTVLQPAHTYAELSPESRQVVDEYTKKLLKNLGKRD